MLRLGASRSMRRSATVTISQPEAASAALVSSALRYLPVPSINRERKLRPPISSGSSEVWTMGVSVSTLMRLPLLHVQLAAGVAELAGLLLQAGSEGIRFDQALL